MSKLVDKERLAKLAAALDARMKAAVAGEEGRAKAAEQGLQNAIDAINNAETGILAQAEAKDKADRDAQLLVDQEQDRRIKALEDDAPVKQAAIEAAQKAADDAQDDVDAVVERLDAEDGLVDRIEANEANIAKLDGDVNTEGSVKKQIKDAIDAVNSAAGSLEERVEANENKLAGLEKDTVKAEIQAAQAAAEAEASRLDGVMQEALQAEIDKKVAQADYDVKIKALEDEDVRIAGLVATEQGRAEGAEQAINAEIANMKDATKDGSLAKQIADEVTARENADNDLSDRIAVFEAGGAQDVAAKEVRLVAAEEDIARLDGADTVEGSVKKQIKDAISEVNGAADALAGRVKANEDKLAGLEEGCTTVQAAIDKAEADAKAHAEQKIAELVDSAPDAMNTLNELAKAINDNKDVYDAYVEEHAQAMAQQKADLQAEIDADVKVVADELAKQKDAAQEGTLAKQIADEKSRAEGQEAAIRQELANEKAALQKEIDDDVKAVVDAQKLVNDAQAETNEDFEGRIAANEAFVAAQPAIDAEQDRRLNVLEAKFDGEESVDARIQAAQDAADAAQADADALEGRLDNEGGLVDRLEAAEAFVAAQPAIDEAQQDAIDDLVERMEAMEAFEEAHDHSVMEQGIADNKAAIEKEVEDRDAAIEEALEAYSTTEEMKAILGNVVNSLALTMENDKVVLKLGGEDGIALTSVSLDLATDDDIDAIIAGLDAAAE